MHIVFAINHRYLTHCVVTITSILAHHPHTPLHIYILIDRISPQKKAQLQKAFHQHDQVNLEVIYVDLDCFTDLETRDHLTPAVYYRLLIPELITIPKVLYLDADTIVNDSLLELYYTDLADVILAGVENYPSTYLHPQESPGCFNSGVLLLNLEECRRINFKSLALAYTQEHLVFDDQPILNAIVGKRWRVLPPKYNFTSSYLRYLRRFTSHQLTQNPPTDPVVPDELAEAWRRPAIIYYTSANKPWLYFSNHPYRHLYWQYLKMTPFYHPLNPDILADNLRLTRYLIQRNITKFRLNK
ncbi:glycosyltransferase family 8 protein [Gloeomargaritales cyanobacterium VI4D9]|nr:glycosyltransferase family 8 protein [Gloeomargaritales cyanobacterium VI4D9]